LLIALAGLLAALIALLAVQSADTPDESQQWTRFGFDAAGTRVNPTAGRLTSPVVSKFHLLWSTKLPDVADSSPALLHAVPFPDGSTHDVLYLTTKSGRLVAVDGGSGALLWTAGQPVSDTSKVTTSSPFADPLARLVYSCGADGKVHRYDAASGRELRGDGWPVTVTLMPDTEKRSASVNAANGYLYITTASYAGDAPPFQGHLVTVDLQRGTWHVFNATCANRPHLLALGECPDSGAGIWARPGAVIDPVTGNVFVATGNGPYTADQGGNDWGESVLELSGDGTRLIDSYTPRKPNDLYMQDLDLGSTAPALLPPISGSATPLLAVQGSKEAVLRLLNRKNLSGQGGPRHVGGELQTIDAPDHCPVLTQPAVWTDPVGGAIWVFVTNYCAIAGYRVSTTPSGVTTLQQVWSVGTGASSPVMAGGLLFVASTDPHVQAVLALDPHSGRQVWSSATRGGGGSIGPIHWESPIVVGGRLYCSDETGQLSAFGPATGTAMARRAARGLPVGALAGIARSHRRG
jgi:outer membrane protein assembly factor BamB